VRILLASILFISSAAAQDASKDQLRASMVKGKVQVEGSVDLPDEAILDVVLERSMNEANFANPFLRAKRSDMPIRQWVEVKKSEYKGVFSHPICPGFYFVRIEFLTKFQRSNKVGQALTKGTLKEFSVERKVFLGSTDEFLEALRQSVGPVEAIAKKLRDAIDAMSDPKAEMAQISARFDRITDEIDRLIPTNCLTGTLHALKGNSETLATQARGTNAKKSGGGGGGGNNPPPLQRPGGGGQPSPEGGGDKNDPGLEEGFLKPNENQPHTKDDIKLGDRFGKGTAPKGTSGEMNSGPIERAKERVDGISKLIAREIAVLLLEKSFDVTENYRKAADAGLEAQMIKLAEFHKARCESTDQVAQMYVVVTKVDNVSMSVYWEKACKFCSANRPAPGADLDALSRDVEALWSKFDQMIRNSR
jgi:hypothetical protein